MNTYIYIYISNIFTYTYVIYTFAHSCASSILKQFFFLQLRSSTCAGDPTLDGFGGWRVRLGPGEQGAAR